MRSQRGFALHRKLEWHLGTVFAFLKAGKSIQVRNVSTHTCVHQFTFGPYIKPPRTSVLYAYLLVSLTDRMFVGFLGPRRSGFILMIYRLKVLQGSGLSSAVVVNHPRQRPKELSLVFYSPNRAQVDSSTSFFSRTPLLRTQHLSLGCSSPYHFSSRKISNININQKYRTSLVLSNPYHQTTHPVYQILAKNAATKPNTLKMMQLTSKTQHPTYGCVNFPSYNLSCFPQFSSFLSNTTRVSVDNFVKAYKSYEKESGFTHLKLFLCKIVVSRLLIFFEGTLSTWKINLRSFPQVETIIPNLFN